MKIQGRFIAVLAVLGLLIALLPLAPAGAVTGVVKLTGGEKGQFFSDQTGDNIITIEVTDEDLTPTRTGTARLPAPQGTPTTIDLVSAFVAGEKDKTDTFDGGTTNGPCNESQLEAANGTAGASDELGEEGDLPEGRLLPLAADGADADTLPDMPALVGPAPTGVQNIINDRCPDTGDGLAIVVTTTTGVALAVPSEYDGTASDLAAAIDHDNDANTPDVAFGNADYTQGLVNPVRSLVYRFELSEVARDSQANGKTGVGVIGISDIARVVVNGRTATAADTDAANAGGITASDDAPSGSGPWFTAQVATPGTDNAAPPVLATNIPGGGVTHVFVRRVTPQPVANSVSVTYRFSEFDFGGTATPLDDRGSTVRDGGATAPDTIDYTDVSGRVSLARTSGTTLELNAAATGSIIATFAYDVKDEKKKLVTLNSGSAGDRELDTVETSADSNVFEVEVAVFSQKDVATIRDEAGKDTNDADNDGDITVGELNTGSKLGSVDDNRSIISRVNAAAAVLFDDGDATTVDDGAEEKATDFLAKVIPARHGDVISVTYTDASPSTRVSQTATVDLEAPVVTLITPTDNFFTNTSTVSFSVDVVDTDSGVPDSSDGDVPEIYTFVDTGIALGTQIRTPIVDGYRLTANPDGAISEGAKQWFVRVRDKVGNEPIRDIPECMEGEGEGEGTGGADVPCTGTAANEAPKGAAGLNASTADNPFKFTVDTRAPELTSGKTGLYLKNPGVTSGSDQEEEKDNNRTWLRVVFATHQGTAPLDTSTVSADDFRVDGVAPLDYKINAKAQGEGNDEAAKGTAVYLQVGQMDTDSKPEVQLTGEIKDKAGNIRTTGRIPAIADGLDPILTVTPSGDLAEKEITVTISSTESLRRTPMVEATETKPVKGKALENPKPLAASLVTGSQTRWTATFKNVTGQASRQYVAVTGTDLSDNEAKVGVAAKDGDIVTFQVDDASPRLKFVDASGNDLEDTKQEEGAVWIVGQFDEDEHNDDKSRGVTVTELVLTDNGTDEAVPDVDASQVFDSEADCVDHIVTGDVTLDGAGDSTKATAAQTDKCAERTLAVLLTPGEYNIKMTGVDASGNEVMGNVDFTVIEAAPFKLTLRPGINFISIPGAAMGEGGNIDVMLGDHPVTTVSTYDRGVALQGQNPWLRSTKDAETGMFSGDITMIEPGKAYFITATASSEVKVKIQRGTVVELPPTINVRQGYNAIGFWSQSGDSSAEIDDYLNSIGWTVAYSYDPTPGRGWTTIRRGQVDSEGDGLLIEEGKGYLVYATYDAVLTP